MPSIKEFREWFLRSQATTSGSTPDQEPNYTTTTKVKGVTKGNRFLANHFPTEDVFRKLFESLAFKLNKDDRATKSLQGLVKKASDNEVEARTINLDTDFTKTVVPHQLPDIVLAIDGSDSVIGTPVSVGGLTLSVIKRTLGSGRSRRNFFLEFTGGGQIKYLRTNFTMNSTTLATITASGNDFEFTVNSGQFYTFEVLLPFNVDSTSSVKYEFNGTAVLNEAVIFTHSQYGFTELITTAPYSNNLPAPAPTGDIVISIKGSFRVTTGGTFRLQAALLAGATVGNILKGATFTLNEI